MLLIWDQEEAQNAVDIMVRLCKRGHDTQFYAACTTTGTFYIHTPGAPACTSMAG